MTEPMRRHVYVTVEGMEPREIGVLEFDDIPTEDDIARELAKLYRKAANYLHPRLRRPLSMRRLDAHGYVEYPDTEEA